ncbi:SDR family NAD(P)-dependent oxidoreductase [Streptomyces sp. NPDC056987]|uniref:SDR family NAD(P)-dependent oxidoreductase n=1 Tax=Streptomyces sp. NPDC056987 TaxID=3345988 RepID=UPI0036281CBC
MNRRALVTAGTGGIGLETAVGLAAAGYAVTVVGRDAGRGGSAVERINAAGTGTEARFVTADLSSLAEVRSLAERVTAGGALSVLVNNAGAMFDDRRLTPEGIEASFALNHLSPYLLTELLLPALRAGAPSRVVNVTSGSVRIPTGRIDTAERKGSYYGLHAYGRAKLANLAYTLDLARRLKGDGVSVFAADPGGAVTTMTTGTMSSSHVVAPWLRPFWPLVRTAFRRTTSGTPAQAARSSVAAATDPALAGRPGLVVGPDGLPLSPPRRATDPRLAEAVRTLSRRLAPLTGEDR